MAKQMNIEELRAKRDEYQSATQMFKQQADQNMQLALMNEGAASAIIDLLKELEGADNTAPNEVKNEKG